MLGETEDQIHSAFHFHCDTVLGEVKMPLYRLPINRKEPTSIVQAYFSRNKRIIQLSLAGTFVLSNVYL